VRERGRAISSQRYFCFVCFNRYRRGRTEPDQSSVNGAADTRIVVAAQIALKRSFFIACMSAVHARSSRPAAEAEMARTLLGSAPAVST
jgi:hypothetical protein